MHVNEFASEGDPVVFHDHIAATSTTSSPYCERSEDRLDGDHWLRIAGGRIVEHWTNFDQLGILRQLGALPSG